MIDGPRLVPLVLMVDVVGPIIPGCIGYPDPAPCIELAPVAPG